MTDYYKCDDSNNTIEVFLSQIERPGVYSQGVGGTMLLPEVLGKNPFLFQLPVALNVSCLVTA